MIRKNRLNFKLNIADYSPSLVFSEFPADFRPELERCPSCNAVGNCRKHGYYERFITDLDHGEIIDLRIKIPRVLCSCGRSHGIIPDNIVPYRSYSLPFILHILCLYLSGSATIEVIHVTYGISHSTLYRWMSVFLDHKLWWLGALQSDQIIGTAFLKMIFEYAVLSDFILQFFQKTLYSFLQHHANPSNCDHLPPGWLPVQGAPT